MHVFVDCEDAFDFTDARRIGDFDDVEVWAFVEVVFDEILELGVEVEVAGAVDLY